MKKITIAAILFVFTLSIQAIAQDGVFDNLMVNTLQLSGGASSYSGWGYDATNIIDIRPHAQDRPVFVMNNHFGLTFSAHSYYGGIRFYNQAYPALPFDELAGAKIAMSMVDGNVGVGTKVPTMKLDVNTSANADGIKVGAGVTTVESSSNIYFYPSSNYDNARHWLISSYFNQVGDFVIRSGNSHGADPYYAGTTRFLITNAGNVGIGTTTPGSYKLAVEGTIGARRVNVTQTNWADYVFETDYKLPTLAEVERFIKQHKHLPDIPTAREIEANGLDLGDSQAALLKKIEELTLYLIEQDKERKEVQTVLERQQKKLDQQQQEIDSLKKQLQQLIIKN